MTAPDATAPDATAANATAAAVAEAVAAADSAVRAPRPGRWVSRPITVMSIPFRGHRAGSEGVSDRR
ncbi:hypothetical protein ACFVVL_26525 [Kitasatospora sp. NPDC058115]|uniref:hypothetical protein n=1 Tax=Kitasatospora sp. NPDC058115 TaxID=3346347 RepID=UPI0036DEA90E